MWLSMAAANRRNAVSILVSQEVSEETREYLRNVIRQCTKLLKDVNNPAWPWDRQYVRGKAYIFAEDGHFWPVEEPDAQTPLAGSTPS